MILVFLDSDVLLDVLLERQPFFGASAEVLDNKGINCATSLHSILNIHYFTKKKFGEQATRKAIELLFQKLTVVTEDKNLIKLALTSDFSDFEDAVQYYAAISAGAEVIITRNIKDYKHSAIPVKTAEQFLNT